MDPVVGRGRLAVALAALGAAVFLAGAVAAPWLAVDHGVASTLLQLAYRPLCHQLPDRCLDLGAGPVTVCARCLGLYLGGFLGLALPAVLGRTARLGLSALAVVAAPSVLDFGLGLVGLPSLANLPRLLLALPLGLVCGLLLARALVDLTSPGPEA